MTEQEYIYVRDLSNVLTAEHCLRELNSSFNGIPKNEYKMVVSLIDKWKDTLFAKVGDVTDHIQ